MVQNRQEFFGYTAAGKPVTRYWLCNDAMQVGIIDLGGSIQSVIVQNRTGQAVDVALGYDNPRAYETQKQFIGALIGRYGNRIARSRFTLDGVEYLLPANDGCNHLHGGSGFHTQLWQGQLEANELVLRLISPTGSDGYPGTLHVEVRYTLTDKALRIHYQAYTDAPTLCNLTNHAYWNLAGHTAGAEAIARHQICLPAYYFTAINNEAIPTGALCPVADTPLDLRKPIAIGAKWDSPDVQIQNVGGYDHNYVLRGNVGTLHAAGQVYSPDSGIIMSVQTTLPGVQFYSGNSLVNAPLGKGGTVYSRRSGFCLETQFFPDSVHHPAWPQAILRPNEQWPHDTIYQFTCEEDK